MVYAFYSGAWPYAFYSGAWVYAFQFGWGRCTLFTQRPGCTPFNLDGVGGPPVDPGGWIRAGRCTEGTWGPPHPHGRGVCFARDPHSRQRTQKTPNTIFALGHCRTDNFLVANRQNLRYDQ